MSERGTHVPRRGGGQGASVAERKRLAEHKGEIGSAPRKSFAEMLRDAFTDVGKAREAARPGWMQRKERQVDVVNYVEQDGLVAKLLPPPDRHTDPPHRRMWVVFGPSGMPLAQHHRRAVALRKARA